MINVLRILAGTSITFLKDEIHCTWKA
jgi:hypothetical protein